MNGNVNFSDTNEPKPSNLKRRNTSRLFRGLTKIITRLSAPVLRRSHMQASYPLSNSANQQNNRGGSASSHGGKLLQSSNSLWYRTDLVSPSETEFESPVTRHRPIDVSIVPARTSSLVLRNYSSAQLRVDENHSTAAEKERGISISSSSNDEQESSLDSNQPALSKTSGDISTPVASRPNTNDNEWHTIPQGHLGAVTLMVGPDEYLSPRSQWTVTAASLIATAKRITVAEDPSRDIMAFAGRAMQSPKPSMRAYDSYPPVNTATDYSEFSMLKRDFISDIELTVEAEYTGRALFEEPDNIHSTADAMVARADGHRHLLHLPLSDPISVYSREDYRTGEDAEAVEIKAQGASKQFRERTLRTGRVDLTSPLFRQALQNSVDISHCQNCKAQTRNVPPNSQNWRNHSFISDWAKDRNRKKLYGQALSKRKSISDPTLLTALSESHPGRMDGGW